MKRVTYLFWSVVGAIGVVFVLTIYTAVSQRKPAEPAPETIPVPAEMPAAQQTSGT